MDQLNPAIGIDLGTTYSCVGVLQHGKIEIIANELGNHITPSCVAFTRFESLVGEAAKNQATLNSSNTIFDVKRIIGRRYTDLQLIADKKLWPFEVNNTNDGSPCINVAYQGNSLSLSPEQVSGMILSELKKTAEAYLDKPVKNAVITVPAYFNDSQRQATIDAGKIAGLNVLCIISEPTAAAITYGLNKDKSKKKNVLIFDLGGGTFDVSILAIESNTFKVKSLAGNAHLGGEDFDARLVNHFVKLFQTKHKKDISGNKKALYRLRVASEAAKCTLSSSVNAQIQIAALFDYIDFEVNITRARFEELCNDLFKETINHVQSALDDAKLKKGEIDDIILVGGSTRIPKVQKLLQEFFNGRQLKKSVNPDEAVAYGASIRAAILNGDGKNSVEKFILQDVIPLSLGIEVDEPFNKGVMSVVIKRNTIVPNTIRQSFTTAYDDQKCCLFKVYEGGFNFVKDNNFLGEFKLMGLPMERRGILEIVVSFKIDVNGILTVTASDKEYSCRNQIKIDYNKGRLNTEKLKKLRKQSDKFNEESKNFRRRMKAKDDLESYCFSVASYIKDDDLDSKLNVDDRKIVTSACQRTITWLEMNEHAEIKELKSIHKKIEETCSQIIGTACPLD